MRFYFLTALILSLFFTSPGMAKELDFGETPATPMRIEKIVLLDKDSSPIPFGGSAEFEAITFPEGIDVLWSARPDEGSKAEVIPQINGSHVTLIPTPESSEGWIVLEASVGAEQKTEAKIYVGCQSCEDGACDFAGSGFVTLGSVDIRISLGKADQGEPAGDLFITADKPTAALYTPELLQLSSTSQSVTPIYEDGILKQVVTPQALVIISQESSSAYEILFFRSDDQGDLADGLYEVKPFAEPMTAWRIENPQDQSSSSTDLLVTEFRLSSERRYAYSYSEDNDSWSLISGNGLKKEVRTTTYNSAGDRVERTTISGSDLIPVMVTEKVYHRFDWGEERVAEINDPDGDRLITRFTYHENKGAGYSKIASPLFSSVQKVEGFQ